MTDYELYVFDYNYSSWSMRAGVLMRASGLAYRETRLNLDDATRASIGGLSPSKLLPLLRHGSLKIWDSLAIAEYLAEQCREQPLWPRDPHARAVARAASAEMHSGFTAMRGLMSMNIRAFYPRFPRPLAVERDVQRVFALWRELRSSFGGGGEYLCGEFGIVDAMFAPVVMRFRSYDVRLDAVCGAYADALERHPAVQGWLDAARSDPYHLEAYDYVVDA